MCVVCMCVCVCVRACTCMRMRVSSIDGHVSGYNDCLTGFCEPLLLPYKCHTGLKNALCDHWVYDNNCCCPLSQRTTVPTALFDFVSTQQQKPQIYWIKILILNKQKSIKQLFFIIKQTPLAWNAVFFSSWDYETAIAHPIIHGILISVRIWHVHMISIPFVLVGGWVRPW